MLEHSQKQQLVQLLVVLQCLWRGPRGPQGQVLPRVLLQRFTCHMPPGSNQTRLQQQKQVPVLVKHLRRSSRQQETPCVKGYQRHQPSTGSCLVSRAVRQRSSRANHQHRQQLQLHQATVARRNAPRMPLQSGRPQAQGLLQLARTQSNPSFPPFLPVLHPMVTHISLDAALDVMASPSGIIYCRSFKLNFNLW